MDEDAVSADQARRLSQGMAEAGIRLQELWIHYFGLGGVVNHVEVDAYLHQALKLPAMQRDLLVQALAELADGHRIAPVPFTWDYPTTGQDSSAPELVNAGAPLDPAGDPPDPPDPADPPPDPPDPPALVGVGAALDPAGDPPDPPDPADPPPDPPEPIEPSQRSSEDAPQTSTAHEQTEPDSDGPLP